MKFKIFSGEGWAYLYIKEKKSVPDAGVWIQHKQKNATMTIVALQLYATIVTLGTMHFHSSGSLGPLALSAACPGQTAPISRDKRRAPPSQGLRAPGLSFLPFSTLGHGIRHLSPQHVK